MAKSVLRDGGFVMGTGKQSARQLAVRLQARSARLTKFAVPQIDPLYGVRRSHHALIVFAMPQVERVPEFVDAFLQQSLTQQGVVLIHSVEFLPEPECGDDRARPAYLRFAKHILENWNIEIYIGNCEKPPIFRADKSLHALQ